MDDRGCPVAHGDRKQHTPGVVKHRRIRDVVSMKGLLATSIGRLRLIAFIEGVSYVVLVFIAMPLKYWAEVPAAVRIVGMVHGVLFVAFSLALLVVFVEQRLSLRRSALTFASSLVPMGTFVIDGYLQRWEREVA